MVTTAWFLAKCANCGAKYERSQHQPWTKTIGGSPAPAASYASWKPAAERVSAMITSYRAGPRAGQLSGGPPSPGGPGQPWQAVISPAARTSPAARVSLAAWDQPPRHGPAPGCLPPLVL